MVLLRSVDSKLMWMMVYGSFSYTFSVSSQLIPGFSRIFLIDTVSYLTRKVRRIACNNDHEPHICQRLHATTHFNCPTTTLSIARKYNTIPQFPGAFTNSTKTLISRLPLLPSVLNTVALPIVFLPKSG